MKNVLLIDSGSGGINILKECEKICGGCNFLMFCDQKNLPYGDKTVEELQEITLKNLRDIRKFFDFQIVVLACNTLSCTVLERCREEFSDVVFVGTVPAVKPALERYAAEDVLMLATPVTLAHNVSLQKNPLLQTLPLSTLASEIDAHLDELWVLEKGLKERLSDVRAKAVVLGCTHYIAVREILQKIMGEEVEFFSSENGVARRLKSFVGEAGSESQVQFMISGNEKMLPIFWEYYIKDF